MCSSDRLISRRNVRENEERFASVSRRRINGVPERLQQGSGKEPFSNCPSAAGRPVVPELRVTLAIFHAFI